MRRTLMVLATAASMALLASGVAVAQTVSTDFEDFTLGTVNGQRGWTSAPFGGLAPSPTGEFDQEVVANSGAPAAFGGQSLRMSNRYASGAFAFQTYSERVAPAAGENQTNTVYDAQFSFIPTTPEHQDGLYMTISPDDTRGARMSWIDLRDTQDGISVDLSDASGPNGAFRTHHAGVLSHGEPHTIRFWIKVIPGPANDYMRLFVDGRDLGECFTTWEEYYRNLAPPTEPPTINSLQFRLSVPGPEPLFGAGYLFDNVTATAAPSASTDCEPDDDPDVPDNGGGEPDVVIDKTTTTPFAEPGDLLTYRISVRNRGDAAARGLRACDRPPRALRFVRATRRLQRAAKRRLCLTIRQLNPGQRRTFRATFRLRAGATADSITNNATASASHPSAPTATPPERPRARARSRRRVHGRDAARVRVVDRPGACPAAAGPRARAAC
jgi:uncharacterized repeat protein (TIGR01451 family)